MIAWQNVGDLIRVIGLWLLLPLVVDISGAGMKSTVVINQKRSNMKIKQSIEIYMRNIKRCTVILLPLTLMLLLVVMVSGVKKHNCWKWQKMTTLKKVKCFNFEYVKHKSYLL